MKKFIVILLTVLLISSFVTPASAAQITEHVFNQDVTCYVAASGSLTASGNTPRLGYVAVHPKEWGNGSVAIVPFGAIITTNTALNVPNAGQMSVFYVQDIGDVNNTEGSSTWWFDIYIGLNTSANISAAKAFGLQTVSYTCTYAA